MFLIPFVFAGFFMLSVLNPRYTATLLSQAISQTPLLGRALSPVVGLLARSPLGSSGSPGSQWLFTYYPPALPHSPNVSETVNTRHPTFGPPKLGLCGSLGMDAQCASVDSSQDILESHEVLALATLVLLLYLLWSACASLVNRVRVPPPLSPVISVEDLMEQPGPKAFTPSNSCEGDGLLGDKEPEDSGSIPAKLEFVTSLGNGLSFTVDTRTPLDTIPAVPMRVSTSPTQPTACMDELEGPHTCKEEPKAGGPRWPHSRLNRPASSPLLEDAVMYTVVPTKADKKKPSPVCPASPSEPLHAFIEEIVDDKARPRSPCDQTAKRSQPRPKGPPVTVWPRVSEPRRSRMQSTQPPVETAATNSGAWDQPRRSRTVSGM